MSALTHLNKSATKSASGDVYLPALLQNEGISLFFKHHWLHIAENPRSITVANSYEGPETHMHRVTKEVRCSRLSLAFPAKILNYLRRKSASLILEVLETSPFRSSTGPPGALEMSQLLSRLVCVHNFNPGCPWKKRMPCSVLYVDV